jgi:hypothetical protein
LKPIIHVDEFFHPRIAFDNRSNLAIVADSQGCPEPICVTTMCTAGPC